MILNVPFNKHKKVKNQNIYLFKIANTFEEEFFKKTSYEKFLDYMKSEKNPILDKGDTECIVTVNEKSEDSMQRICVKKLPITKATSLIIGVSIGTFIYEISYDSERFVSVTSSPHPINKYFEYTETIVVDKIDETTVKITRETTTHKVKNIPFATLFQGSSEKYFHHQSKRYLNAILEDCI